jgi:protein-S-isoprenylcysteine O-methyltransferase Ste14
MGNKTRKAGRIIAIFFGVIFWLTGAFFTVIMLFSTDHSTKIASGIVGIILFAIAFLLSVVAGRLKKKKTPRTFSSEQRYN